MVAPTPKAPRYTLSEKERLICREALLSERHERRIRRAGQKDSVEGVAKMKKATRKKAAKHTTPGMEIAESKGTEPSAEAALRTITAEAKDAAAPVASDAKETGNDEAVEISTTAQEKMTGKQTVGTTPSSQPRSSHVLDDVEAVINGMLATIVGDEAAATPIRVLAAHGKTASSKRKGRSADEESCKRHRRILHEDASEGDAATSPIDGAAAGAQAESTPVPDFVIDGDPNLMEGGAEECTGLNSDENVDLREEPEDQDEDGTDSWDGDWDIGALTDEDPEEDHDELPDSLGIFRPGQQGNLSDERAGLGTEADSAQILNMLISMMGHTDQVLLEIADDHLALLFYFMPYWRLRTTIWHF
ncbi:hypothetical protein PR003_g9192 [Phytophthora rubi]|uniref:Uncharacterized protein n=1 Tax=Phytophthora rubi TaxID=129364 RepID=A0A6A3N5K4_9STRA|nr:hypothetical protein PR002_g22812 [Phytophthora rubi]KAE9036215.1 hypothetical protein PR001_g8939 [Phytophthora rubi]KAE9342993.1 hypothetical protein PR003_g9192 [Phytophthora rubi]